MRHTSRAVVSSILLASLAIASAPVFASKPSQPPGQAKHASPKQQTPAKSANRGSSERASSGKQPGFVASNGRSNQYRGDDRRDDRDRNDWRGDDRHDDRDWDGHDRDRRDWDRDDRDRHDWDRRDWDRDDRDRHDWDRRDWDHHDSRWDRNDWDRNRWRHHDRRYYYPRPGYVVHRLPVNYRVVRYYDVPYYYGGGSWYRPHGSLFSVVTPPIGLMISFLPDVYTTLWIGGIPYYRANDIYYRWRPEHRAYMVTALPPGHY